VPRRMDTTQLLKVAEDLAEARLRQLQEEIAFLYESFPALKRRPAASASAGTGVATGALNRALNTALNTAPPGALVDAIGRTRKKPVWSAAKRRSAAERMRKYWAGRRAAEKQSAAKTSSSKRSGAKRAAAKKSRA
jgi:hypothetical protein